MPRNQINPERLMRVCRTTMPTTNSANWRQLQLHETLSPVMALARESACRFEILMGKLPARVKGQPQGVEGSR